MCPFSHTHRRPLPLFTGLYMQNELMCAQTTGVRALLLYQKPEADSDWIADDRSRPLRSRRNRKLHPSSIIHQISLKHSAPNPHHPSSDNTYHVLVSLSILQSKPPTFSLLTTKISIWCIYPTMRTMAYPIETSTVYNTLYMYLLFLILKPHISQKPRASKQVFWIYIYKLEPTGPDIPLLRACGGCG